ncbi:hypothetical protein CEUSTIGMA_g6912.t1 [Chlamydomonas eustigma]|uniref:Ion transport domain-containing protein n=1 Tax=Chlamydomonas eustigma TaxID=1157962 RepID=A0A250X8R0_9CHLO|nr:hypothetical protein CEUSTIGMA_g6912.t1 [Chlamydomonas eustigma]|eukprot:GAX79471.1 hypothetical protein CEUSTIGMA_g6912.t1 [Chlamydomonas eustigma]
MSERKYTAVKVSMELKASQTNVAQQAKLMDSVGTSWYAVKHGNLEMITKLFPSQCNVYLKGPVGENVFHVAMLLNTPSSLAIAKYLVKLYGKQLVNTPYQERSFSADTPGQYEGETALHIAIVNRDFDMVKFLIQNGADVRARAYGAFFQKPSPVSFGEFPLSFAACTGQKDIVSYLKRHGAHINTDRDTEGNTALHMCIYHDQNDMYDHLVEYCGASENVRNNRGQTPMLLAASLGKVEMFQHIYNRRRHIAWAYGPVTSYSLSLHEIDTARSPSGLISSAIETMVRKGHVKILSDPLVSTLIATKWERFARGHFLVHTLLYLVFVVLQVFLIWLHCSPPQWNQQSIRALEIASIILAGLFLLLEALDIYIWTEQVYLRRALVKANVKYSPPLYPIPGEVPSEPQESTAMKRLNKFTTQFSTRFFKAGAGPVSEGCEQVLMEKDLETYNMSSFNSESAQGDAPHQLGGTFRWWPVTQDDCVVNPEVSSRSRAVAEGLEIDAHVHASTQLDGRSTHASAEVSAFHGNSVASSVHNHTPSQNTNSNHTILSPKTSSGMLSIDIVSVGLPPSLVDGMFYVPQRVVTSMLSKKRGVECDSLPSGLDVSEQKQAPVRRPPPRQPSLVREGSEIGSMASEGELIKNRLRGGGGGDFGASSIARRPDLLERMSRSAEEAAKGGNSTSSSSLYSSGIKDNLGTLWHALHGYYSRQCSDPVTLMMMLHLWLSVVHFTVWASSYGGVNGTGPSQVRVQEFDDVIVSLIALSGWSSMLYFSRGLQSMGQLHVVLEHCLVELVKFACFFFLADIGFTLAFFTLINGTSVLVPHAQSISDNLAAFEVPYPFSSIGFGMVQVIRFLYGEAQYNTYSATSSQVTKAFATIYFVLYVALIVLLLSNFFVAMIIRCCQENFAEAEKVWRLRWTSYVLRTESRLPQYFRRKYRLGEASYDPGLQTRVYNHVFEVVDSVEAAEEKVADQQLKALEAAIDRLKKGGKK